MLLNISISEVSEMDRNIILKLIPNGLELTDLKDRRSVGRLVRGRKK